MPKHTRVNATHARSWAPKHSYALSAPWERGLPSFMRGTRESNSCVDFCSWQKDFHSSTDWETVWPVEESEASAAGKVLEQHFSSSWPQNGAGRKRTSVLPGSYHLHNKIACDVKNPAACNIWRNVWEPYSHFEALFCPAQFSSSVLFSPERFFRFTGKFLIIRSWTVSLDFLLMGKSI